MTIPTAAQIFRTMHEIEVSDMLTRLLRRNPRYAEQGYLFVLAALHQSLERLSTPRHV